MSSRGGEFVIESVAKADVNLNAILDKNSLGSNNYFIDQGYYKGAIKFTDELSFALYNCLLDAFSSDNPLFYIVPSNIVNICGNQLKEYIVRIKAYLDSPNPVQTLSFLIEGIRNPKFAELQKSIRLMSFTYSSNLSFLSDETLIEYKDIPRFVINDIGDIFNYNYCFFWEEPEDPEDYKYGLIPIKEPTSLLETEFKDALRRITPDLIYPVPIEETLLNVSGSSCAKLNSYKCSSKHFIERSKSRFKLDPNGIEGIRSRIPVSPANYRDGVLLPPEKSECIRILEKQTQVICESTQWSAYYRDPEKIKELVQNLKKNFKYFIDRDITKEGITKPRFILKWILEVFKEKYPYCPAWDYSGIYNDYILHDNEEIIFLNRGHGLGMANALTTIMQCVIFQITLERAHKREIIVGEVGALHYNDDMTCGFTNQIDLENYWDEEADVMRDYSLIRKDKKSHRGKNFVFCEIYSDPEMNKKKSYIQSEIYSIFAAKNIYAAKLMFQSISPRLKTEDEIILRNSLISFFGIEFGSFEVDLPFYFGGWGSAKIGRTRYDHYMINEVTFEISRAFKACIAPARRYKAYKVSSKKIYNDPINQFYGPYLKVPEEAKKKILYREMLQDVYSRLGLKKNVRELEKALDETCKNRRKIFQERIDQKLTKEEILDILKERFPEYDFVPFPGMCSTEPLELSSQTNFELDERRFSSWTPILSYLKYWNPDVIPDNIIPDRFSFTRLKTESGSEISASDLMSKIKSKAHWPDEYKYITILPPILNKNRGGWREPRTMCSIYTTLTGDFSFPIPYVEEREEETTYEYLLANFGKKYSVFTYLCGSYKTAVDYLLNPIQCPKESTEEEYIEDSDEEMNDFLEARISKIDVLSLCRGETASEKYEKHLLAMQILARFELPRSGFYENTADKDKAILNFDEKHPFIRFLLKQGGLIETEPRPGIFIYLTDDESSSEGDLEDLDFDLDFG